MKNQITLLILGSILAGSFSFAQGGWTQGKNKYYVKAAFQTINSDTHFDQNGIETKNDDFGISSLGIYGEYGKTDNLTLTAYIPVFTAFNQPNQVTLPGSTIFENTTSLPLGDLEIGAKYKLFKNKHIATALTGKLRLPLGGGEFNQGLTLSAGIPISNTKNFSIYSNVYGGANNRPSDFSDEWRYGVELGLGYRNKIWLFLKQDNIKSFENVQTDLDSQNIRANELYGNGYGINTLSGELSYFITDTFGLSIHYLNVYDGQLSLKGNTYTGGVFWNLR